MGVGHSRAGELHGNSLQSRRHCFWCLNGRSFDDLYEPATSTITSVVCDTNEMENVQPLDACFKDNYKVKSQENKGVSEEPNVSFVDPSTSVNFSKCTANANSEERQQQNCSKRPFDDISDNLFPYSHFTHDTLMQIIRCFPFATPRSSSEPWSSPDDRRHAKLLSRSCDLLQIERPNAVSRSCSASDAKKCNSTNSNEESKQSRRKITEPKMVAVAAETRKSAVEKLALVSADTMAITALPLDCWLKERLKNWVQLSGHEGTIVPATDQTLWKRRSCSDYNEGNAYRALMNDRALDGFVPRYYREVKYKNESFIEIQDLTALFDDPAIMDIKIGTRTFLESEVKNTVKRNDLYVKMMALNPNEPTEEEHAAKAVTKMRYMQFRERESSTATLGCRIEAAKMPGGVLQKSFKKVRTREDVKRTLATFFGDRMPTVGVLILQRLKRLREAAEKSAFFRTHEVIGSSLLLMYDSSDANVWMIDFAKSVPVERDSVNHRREWICGNHEDGYFKGLDNLIEVMEELVAR